MNNTNLLGYNVKLPMKSIFAINQVGINEKFNVIKTKYPGTYVEDPSRRYNSDAFKYSRSNEIETLNVCVAIDAEAAFPDRKIIELNNYSYYPRIKFEITRNKVDGTINAHVRYPYNLAALRILNMSDNNIVVNVKSAEIAGFIPNIVEGFIENSKKVYIELTNINTAMAIDYSDVQETIETMFASHGFTKTRDTDKSYDECQSKTQYLFRFTHPICGDAGLTVVIEPNLFQIKDYHVMAAEMINRCTYNNTGYTMKFGTIEGLYAAVATVLDVYDYMGQRFTEAKNKFDLLPMC